METIELVKSALEAKVPGLTVELETGALRIAKEHWLQAALELKNDSALQFDYLSSVTGVDYKDHFEVVYHLYSVEQEKGQLTVKVKADREPARLPSVTPVWRSAEFQEREIFDLFGIHFEDHPDLRRILMWEGFEHHPMRKDYIQENQDRQPAEF